MNEEDKYIVIDTQILDDSTTDGERLHVSTDDFKQLKDLLKNEFYLVADDYERPGRVTNITDCATHDSCKQLDFKYARGAFTWRGRVVQAKPGKLNPFEIFKKQVKEQAAGLEGVRIKALGPTEIVVVGDRGCEAIARYGHDDFLRIYVLAPGEQLSNNSVPEQSYELAGNKGIQHRNPDRNHKKPKELRWETSMHDIACLLFFFAGNVIT